MEKGTRIRAIELGFRGRFRGQSSGGFRETPLGWASELSASNEGFQKGVGLEMLEPLLSNKCVYKALVFRVEGRMEGLKSLPRGYGFQKSWL